MSLSEMNVLSVAVAAAGTGFALALPLGAGLPSSGAVLAAAVPASLLAAAGIVLLRPPRAPRTAAPSRLRPEPGAYPPETEAPPLSPEGWLGLHKVLAGPAEGRRASVEAALSGQLGQADLSDPALRILLVAIQAHAAGSLPGWDGPGALLDELGTAMRLPPEPRAKALAALAPRVGDPAPDRRHHFVETRFLAALDAARARDGLSSGAFAWLRFHRRGLWFALNNLGRPTFYAEGLGPIAHHASERAAGEPIREASVAFGADILMDLVDDIEGTAAPAGKPSAPDGFDPGHLDAADAVIAEMAGDRVDGAPRPSGEPA
jgi:hypothetical protein